MAQNNMQVAHYSTKEGLPHDIVYCSLKSKDSFLWFGTWFGLSRFDGSRFANYSDAYISSSDQPPRKVEWLAEDALGNLWIKTLDWKLSVFFKQIERFEDVYEELKPYARNLQVIKIQADGTGKILLLTKDKNLLLAETLKDGSIRIQTLVDARKYINTFNYQLRQDVVQLKASRANYVGKDYQIYSVPVTAKTGSGRSACGSSISPVNQRNILFIIPRTDVCGSWMSRIPPWCAVIRRPDGSAVIRFRA